MACIVGTGVDLVAVERIASIGRRSPALFLERVFGACERALLAERPDWRRCARHIAAKEALVKALGTGLIGAMRWTDTEVLYADGRPTLKVSGATAERLARLGGPRILLSLGGNRHYAMATVILAAPKM